MEFPRILTEKQEWMTVKELAEILGCTEHTARRKVKTKENGIDYFILGRTMKIHVKSVERFITEQVNKNKI